MQNKEQGNVADDLDVKKITEPHLTIFLTTDEDDDRPVYIS